MAAEDTHALTASGPREDPSDTSQRAAGEDLSRFVIVHVIRGKADPNTLNGVNRIVHGLATAQAAQGQHVQVWGISDSPGEVRHAHAYPLRMFKAFGFRMTPPAEIRGAIAQLPPARTVVHFHSVLVREFYAIVRELEARGIEWVHSPHGGYNPNSLRRNWLLKRIYYGLFERRLMGGASAVLATGRSEVSDIHALEPRADVVLIPNGQEAQPRLEATPDRGIVGPLFGFCGRLAIRHKGLDLLIDGFARYVREGGRGSLWLIGDGEDAGQLRRQVAALGLEDRVTFKGPQFGDVKTRMLCQLDFFLHTSRWEGLPMVLLDASALGIPMLVSEATNFGEFVRADGTGLCLERNDPETIAKGLLSLDASHGAGDPDRVRTNARAAASSRPDWDVISKRIERELYSYANPLRPLPSDRSPGWVLGDLFKWLEERDVTYAVVGDARVIPYRVTSDVDLVFHQSDVPKVADLIAEFARVNQLSLAQIIRHENTAYYCCLVWTAGDELQTLVIDYCGDYVRESRLIISANDLLDGRVRVAFDGDVAFYVPRPSVAFLYYLAKRLDKNTLDARSISYMREFMRSDRQGCVDAFLTIWRERDLDDLHAIFAEPPDAARSATAAARLRDRARVARPGNTSLAVGSLARIVDRLVNPTGLSVAFIGPDGAGKSTVAREVAIRLAPAFRRLSQYHLRPTLGTSAARKAVTDPHGLPDRGTVVSVAKLIYFAAAYFVGYWSRIRVDVVRSTFVVFDRYVYDLVVDTRRWRYGGPKALLPMLAALAPKPDLAVYLDVDPAVMLTRKREVSQADCERQVAAYGALAVARPEVHRIDGGRGLDEVVGDTLALVVHRMAHRTKRRLRRLRHG